MDFSGNILTFDFEFICEYCGAATDNKNWMNKFNFERWIEIKLQLSNKFRHCNLPSSKDFNENKTDARKDEAWPGIQVMQVSQVFVWNFPDGKIGYHLPHKTELCLRAHSTLMDLSWHTSQWAKGAFYRLFLPWQCPGLRLVGSRSQSRQNVRCVLSLTVSQLPGKFPL